MDSVAVLSRIKLSFSDTVIRLEHLPKSMKTGVGLEIRIKRYMYLCLWGHHGNIDWFHSALNLSERPETWHIPSSIINATLWNGNCIQIFSYYGNNFIVSRWGQVLFWALSPSSNLNDIHGQDISNDNNGSHMMTTKALRSCIVLDGQIISG